MEMSGNYDDYTSMMIAFAKLHRKAILEEIAEDYLYTSKVMSFGKT
jgi:hypothetical protein